MAYKSYLLDGLAVMLKIGGAMAVLIGLIALFLPGDQAFLIFFGLCMVLLGYFVNLLDEMFHRPESLPPLDSPSLRFRWKAGFVAFFACGYSLSLLYQPIGGAVDWLIRDESLSADAALAFKVLAFVLLVPLLFAVLSDGQILARTGAAWLRGFRLVLVAGLVVLPWLLLKLAYGLVVRFGLVEAGSRMDSGLKLLVLGVSIALVPFWVLPLFRRLSRLPWGRDVVVPFLQKHPAALPDEAL